MLKLIISFFVFVCLCSSVLLSKDTEKFYPYIQEKNEEIAVVNALWSPDRNQFYFSLQGYIFKQNENYPVELGDQFYIYNQEKEILTNDSYRFHLTLRSLTTGASHFFYTEPLNDSPYVKIVSAKEIRRVQSMDAFDDYYGFGIEYLNSVIIEYEVELENGLKTKVCYFQNKEMTRKEFENKENKLTGFETFYIQGGDYMSFDSFVFEPNYGYRGVSLYWNEGGKMINFHKSTGHESVKMMLRTPLRNFDDKPIVKVLAEKINHGKSNNTVVHFDNFGSLDGKMYFESKTTSLKEKYASNRAKDEIKMIYRGYLLQSDGKRVYVFEDSVGNVIQVKKA